MRFILNWFTEEKTVSKIDPQIFKAYDIRGVYPDQLNEEIAYKIGRGFVEYLKPQNCAMGRDMRLSSPALWKSLTEGIIDGGTDVFDLGLCSTDGLYFAVGKFGYHSGIMITASHNPPEYNGMKMCSKDAVPLSGEEGINQIKELVIKNDFHPVGKKGRIKKHNIDRFYTEHVLSFIDTQTVKPFKIVIDAGNGIAGKIIPDVFSHLPCQIIPMLFELDGSFPHHLPNPMEPANIEPLQKKVLEEKADLGAAFDGDADRMFLVDEKGNRLGGDMVTALVAKNLLKKEKGTTILYNLICSKTVPEIIQKEGGKAIRTKVGHALIKPLMKKYNAIFGGEHSGHFYFRNNWYADSGLIALLVCLELISEEEKPLSLLVKSIDRYYRSGEINTPVENMSEKIKEVERHFLKRKIDHLDGLTVEYKDWWFNLRPSNTEPLLRLNIEASDPKLLEEKKEQLLKIIRR